MAHALRRLAVAAVLSLGDWSLPSANATNCDPNVLTDALAACGMDIGCMNQATADFNAQCMGQTPDPSPTPVPSPSPSPGPMTEDQVDQRMAECGMDIACMNRLLQDATSSMGTMPQGGAGGMGGTGGTGGTGGGMGGGTMAAIQACGNDPACLQQMMNDMQNGPGMPPNAPGSPGSGGGSDEFEFDTTKRLGESTVLSASWLQSYQEALVTCADDGGCWTGHMAAANGHIESRCGTNLMSEATMICQIAARYEVHIEQAIAMQRLWRQGIRMDQGAAGTGAPGTPSPTPAATPPAASPPSIDPEPASVAFAFLPEVSESKVCHILDRWEDRLEGSVPQEARDKIAAAAAAFPTESEEGTPPLIYEEVETADGLSLDGKPTRRDWAYGLTAALLTHAGFVEGGSKGQLLLDSAFWSLIQAARLKLEPEHLNGIGFHLNLRAKLEDARDILAHARKLSPESADTENNLAFSYAAMGRDDEAEALQQNAARLAPNDTHIRARLDSMLGNDGTADANDSMPYGGDFGEAFFRLGKRHTLREYWAGKGWFKSRELAKGQAFGGTPQVDGPAAWYSKQIKDIEDARGACAANAPEVLRGCPFGDYILHPSCKGAATREQVERSRHNRQVALCQCGSNALMARADALSAYLDRAIAVWSAHEKIWWPRLNRYVRAWSADIKAVNARYADGSFEFPVESGYWGWIDEFREDSEDAWGTDIPDIHAKWYDLKTAAQNMKSCGSRLPPIPDPPKKPKPKKEEKVSSYGINLFVVEIKLSMNGDFKFGFDLGVVKGGYERIAGKDGHKVSIGSGPLEFSYQHNGNPGPGGNATEISMTASTNFLKFVPGAGGIAANIADQFVSFGGKYEAKWGNRSGYSGQAQVESKSKFGFNSQNGGTRYQN